MNSTDAMTGKIRLTTSGLDVEGPGLQHDMLRFVDCLMRGIGQVMFQNNSYAGLLFFIGIAMNSLLFAIAAMAGSAAGTLTAMLMGADRGQIRSGMFGFNAALVGIALMYFLEPTALNWVCLILASACSTILMAAMMAAFGTWKLPVLTAPFIFTSLIFFLATARFGRLEVTGNMPAAGLPARAAVEGVVTAPTIGEGLLNGIAEVFFQANLASGLLFAVGLLIASRVAFVMALAGSLIGLVVAWWMGAAEPAIRAGAYGFNSVLTAIALADVFLERRKTSFLFALLGAIVTPFVVAACAAAFEPLGMPALTLPFVLTTWIFLLASQRFPKITGLPPTEK